MQSSRSTSSDQTIEVNKGKSTSTIFPPQHNGYQWTALSVTTVGALLASIQGSALLIALPSLLAELHIAFFTVMWVLLGYLLILTVFTPIVGRLADLSFLSGLHLAFFVSFVLSIVAAIVAALRSAH